MPKFELPPLPGTQTRAFGLVAQPDVTFRALGSVVEADPALTAAVLRAANSASSAPIGHIESAEQALIRIGIERTKRIVAGAIVSSNLAAIRRSGLDSGELWRHLVACALLADTTAWGEVRHTASFTAGLMHDVGRLAMAHSAPAQYAEVVALVRSGADATEAEQRVFGVDHVTVGVDVARAWELSDDLVEVIHDHHLGALSALSWVTWNSRRVSWALGIGDGVETPPGLALDPAGEDAPIVEALGGADALLQQVEWYTGAITGALAA